MTDPTLVLAALEKRVATLEAKFAVSNAAYHWIRVADRVETRHRREPPNESHESLGSQRRETRGAR